ncbi:MAG: hypothetical protein K0S09_915 [Sphingobacteriaceae bacterium]|jgi:hypothetical protein|nr:hypothetical protein [Sphingobacteriaceae bacterium]
MSKHKILVYCVIALVVLNVACLAFIVLGRPKPPLERFDKQIIRSLNLNQEQVQTFNKLKDQHHGRMTEIDEQMKQPFEEYFGLLNRSGDQTKKDSLEIVLASLYKQKVDATYEHFDEIKKICSPEQQKGFEKIIPSLMQVISPQKNDMPGRGK